MRSTDFALKHRTTVGVLIFMLVVVGMVSYLSLPREAAPDIKFPYIVTMISYPGVSPEDMESLVTTRLEAKFEDLTDVEEMTSTSSEGLSLVFLEFQPDTDITEATQRVRDRVNRARSELPDDIMEPDVKEISSSDWPILKVNISGNAGLVRMKRLAEELRTEIEAFPGVLEVDLTGGLEREIRIEVNPHLLLAYGLSLNDVTMALAMENINVPGGPIEEGDMRYTLRIPEELTDPDQIPDFVVSTKFGHPIRIREIADVVDGFKDPGTMTRYGLEEGVALTVKKQAGANIIKVVDAVKELVDSRAESFPDGTHVVYLNDFSKYIRDMVGELENNILTALVLVMLVLFLFIGGRNALFVASAIPLSMLVSFIVLQALGITLNMVTLFSLILALGMLVDNAIVIIENIYRHRSMGKTALQAAMDGTNEVGWPVITSTLTTLAVFFPLLAWPGIMGKFMGFLPKTLIVTLASSLFVALFINPVIASAFMGDPTDGKTRWLVRMLPWRWKRFRKAGNKGKEPVGTSESKVTSTDSFETIPDAVLQAKNQSPCSSDDYGLFISGYRAVLCFALRHRLLVTAMMVVVLIGSTMLYGRTKPQVQFFPETTPDRVQVKLQAPEGTRLERTSTASLALEKFLVKLDNVKHVLAEVGAGGSYNPDGTAHLGVITLDFQDRLERTEDPLQTLEHIRTEMALIPGAEFRILKQQKGPPTGAPVNVEISGNDYEQLAKVAEEVKAKIVDIEGLTDLEDDYDQGRPELELHFNRTLSNQLILQGLQVVAGTVRTAIYGSKATVYRVGDEEFDVTVRLQDRFRENRENVLALTIAGKEGRKVPLSQVIEMKPNLGSSALQHIDRNRVITVSAQVEGRPGPEVLKDVQANLKGYKPSGATLSFTGENEDMKEAQSFMGQALLIGLLLIAMILLTQFNSLGQVFIILFSVILSLSGVMWGLIINRMPFSVMMTGVGIISLAGVVVNNAIVLIDFINKLRSDGMELTAAIVEAGTVRLRPILLTAGTTILGLIPMAQGFDIDLKKMTFETGTGSMEFWGPMAITVIYGLAFATVLTTIVVPVMYHGLEGFKRRSMGLLERHPWLRRLAILALLLVLSMFAYRLIVGLTP